VEKSIDQVSDLRAHLGSLVSVVMESNLDSLMVADENVKTAASSIRDLDFAAETTEFVRTQILFAAGTNILSAANQIPQTVLQLLQ